jgi:cysteine desulfurase
MSNAITYFDHAATTPVAPEVLEAMLPYFDSRYGNPSSRHTLGLDANIALGEVRRALAEAVGCSPTGVVFTGSGTEGDVIALRGVAGGSRRDRHVVVSAIEHAAVIQTARSLEKLGHRVTVAPVDREGRIDADRFVESVTPETAVCALMAVNNELGTVQPVAEVSRRVKEKAPRAHFHVDAVQAFGKLPVSFREWPHVDTIAVSAHKIYGPKGTGALFLREASRLEPVLTGGGQEAGMRSGTHNTPGIAGLGAAYALAVARREQDLAHYDAIDRCLFRLLDERLPEVAVNGPRQAVELAGPGPFDRGRVPYLVNLRFPEVPAEPLLNGLEGEGFYVSSGSACHSKSGSLSHVLTAIGLAEEDGGNLRLSFGRATTEADIERFVDVLSKLVPRLRQAVARRV